MQRGVDAEDGESWTPLRVAERIAEGLRIAVLTGGRVGPAAFGSVWPEYQREFSDKTHRKFDEWMEDVERQAARRFSAEELSLADEALSWPLELIGHPLMRDALWLVSLARAVPRVEVKAVLISRRRRADRMVALRSQGSPDIVRIYEDEAAETAARVIGWANRALAAPLREELRPSGLRRRSPEEAKRLTAAAVAARDRRIRAGARVMFARSVKAEGTVERIVVVRRADVMPGMNFWFSSTYRWFDRGTAEIAARLTEAKVPVR